MPDLNDQHLKRLDHLQGIIQRLAGNSFLFKGWAVTLVSAVLGFALKDANSLPLAYLALVPILLFWGLDAYYLALERNVRKLYNDGAGALHGVLSGAPGSTLPNACISPAPASFDDWWDAALTRATWLIYFLLIVCTVAVGSGVFLKAAKAGVIYVLT
jgi:hypothetical protein